MVWRRGNLVAEVRTASEGRVALLHVDATQPVVLAGPAVAIWQLIDGRREQADVIAALETVFEDLAGRLPEQVEGFLASLEAQQLIEAVDEAEH